MKKKEEEATTKKKIPSRHCLRLKEIPIWMECACMAANAIYRRGRQLCTWCEGGGGFGGGFDDRRTVCCGWRSGCWRIPIQFESLIGRRYFYPRSGLTGASCGRRFESLIWIRVDSFVTGKCGPFDGTGAILERNIIQIFVVSDLQLSRSILGELLRIDHGRNAAAQNGRSRYAELFLADQFILIRINAENRQRWWYP